jgi:anti-anti-sigma factor
MMLELDSRVSGKVHLIQCKGRIVIGEEVKALEAALEQDSRRHLSQVVIELSGATRLDSIGLGLLVRYATLLRKRGGDLRLAAAPGFISQLLEMTRVSDTLRSFRTVEEATASFDDAGGESSAAASAGARVLVIDSSGDFCSFVRTVLTRHGYEVKSSSGLSDAKVMLHIEKPEHIFVGPGNPNPDFAAASLRGLCPRSQVVQLDADFKGKDAHAATEALLRLLGTVPR